MSTPRPIPQHRSGGSQGNQPRPIRYDPLAYCTKAALTRHEDTPPLRCHWRPTWCPRWLWAWQWVRALIWSCRRE